MASKRSYITVAIDFGTTFSGYAFQLTGEYDQKDPTNNILCPQAWNNGSAKLLSLKTPTCLLLKQDKSIHSFGYAAEEKYAGLSVDNEHVNWYYFRRFKMNLHESKNLDENTKLKDATGKELPAVDVFSKSIECLKNHLFELLRKRSVKIQEEEIEWVLTVPAIWDDRAKLFMRQAAKKAGIPPDQLSIALEPEAASLFCQYLPVAKFSVGGQVKFSDAKPGTTYMILDLGGGTADITVHEKIANGKLKEVHKASGGPWGGTAVDRAFITMFSDIVGGPIFSEFMKEKTFDFLDLMREFETVKRTVNKETKEDLKVKLPASLNEVCQSKLKKSFQELVVAAKKDKQIEIKADKIKIDPDLVRNLFKKATNKIISHMNNILNNTPVGKKIELILMVGGFSESPFVQDVIKAEFHGKNGRKILIPNEAGIAVLKGAVVFGRHPENITSRVLRYTYGVRVTPEFNPSLHEGRRKYTDTKNTDRCNDVFSKFIAVGTSVERGHKCCEKYFSILPFQKNMTLQVYTSPDEEPMYTDEEDCQMIGKLTVDIPNPSEDNHELFVDFVFGDTELHVNAVEGESKKPCCVKLSLPE